MITTQRMYSVEEFNPHLREAIGSHVADFQYAVQSLHKDDADNIEACTIIVLMQNRIIYADWSSNLMGVVRLNCYYVDIVEVSEISRSGYHWVEIVSPTLPFSNKSIRVDFATQEDARDFAVLLKRYAHL